MTGHSCINTRRRYRTQRTMAAGSRQARQCPVRVGGLIPAPQVDRPALVGGGQRLTVAAEGDRIDALGDGISEEGDLLPGRGVIDVGGAAGVAGRYGGAV